MATEDLILGIVVTYNGSSFIINCLDRLIRNMDETCIVVIDNGSSDKTVDLIQEKYKGIILIKLDRNYGFGKANNIGLEIALAKNADFVFMLNQDVYLEDDTISELVETARRYPDYGVLSPIHLNGKGDALDNHFSGYVSSILISDLYLDRLKDIYPCHFINAAAWLLPKKCIEYVGGFDPLFFHYGEDDDYLNRVRYHKMKIGICPGVRINHDRGPHHALSDYPEFRKIYLEALKRLKNINLPFRKAVTAVVILWLREILTSLFLLQFRRMYTLLKVFFSLLFQLGRIRHARVKCKTGSAFIKGGIALIPSHTF
jgi:GT2 family glycosyltransferase